MSAQYISIDDQKKLLPGYVPSKAEIFHSQSAKSADKLFEKALKNDSSPTAILLCGGSASGKTEFCSECLTKENAIIYDGTLSSIHGVEVKIRNIRRARKTPVIIGIIPDDIQRCFSAFLSRDRRFSDEHFYRTHVGARKVLLWIAENEPDVEIRLFESTYSSGSLLAFNALELKTKEQLIAHLRSIQYTEEQIISLVTLS